ncbi:MAG: EmrA/EmrK family multidrug efflux transporter periplasmic adaptor subunit, partial [Burkholderiaceae bacterium]
MDNTATAPDAAPATNPRRKKILLLLILVFLLAGLAYGIYWWLNARNYESTDDAYVQGNVIQITPQVAGTVVAISANDTDFAKAGQTLVKLDPTDAQVALEQARAQLAQAVREVRTLYVNNGSLKASVALREADAAKAATEVARAQADVARRRSLVSTGAV